MREDILAKRMFYGGCLFLPWLWAVNVMYFRRKVFGDIPYVDTWGRSSSNGDQQQQQQESVQDLMPRMGGVVEMAGGGSGEESNEGDNDGGARRRRRNDGEEFDDEHDEDDAAPQLSDAEIQLELSKWVKRSTFGAFFGFALFITWIIVFQVNKNHFGGGWFVMDQDEEDLTGW